MAFQRLQSQKVCIETKQATELLEAYVDCNAKFEDLATKQADHYTNSLERVAATNEFLGIESRKDIDTEKISETQAPTPVTDINDLIHTEKKAAGIIPISIGSNLVHRGMSGMLDPQQGGAKNDGSLEDYQLQGLRALMDPAFLEETKSIETAVNMKKILGQDSVIASHSPREIEEALSEIQTMAPNAVNYEPLLRAMLRKRLESEGRLDDYEIGQLVDTDIKIQGRDTPSQLFPQVKFTGEN